MSAKRPMYRSMYRITVCSNGDWKVEFSRHGCAWEPARHGSAPSRTVNEGVCLAQKWIQEDRPYRRRREQKPGDAYVMEVPL